MSSQNQTHFLVFAFLFCCFINSSYGYQFAVGGKNGWVLNPSESYSSWTGRNRFLVGDTLLFKYSSLSDSVLVVTKTDYDSCNATNPTQKLQGGSSVFALDRSGPFYFISGNKTNCDQGQKLTVVVISPRNRPTPPTGAPSPVAPPGSTSPGNGAHSPGGSPGPTTPGTGTLSPGGSPGPTTPVTGTLSPGGSPGGSPGPTTPGAGTPSPAGSHGTISPGGSPVGSPEPMSPAEGAPGPAMFGPGPTAASDAPGPGSYGSEGPSPSGGTSGLGPSAGSPGSSVGGSGTPADANSPGGSPPASSVAAPAGTPGILLGWVLVGVSVGRFVRWH